MVKRGPLSRPQASEGEAQHGPFCWTGRFGQGDERLHSGWRGEDRAGSEGGERTGRFAACVLADPAYCLKRVGLEAGPLSQWLFSALAEAGFPVICVETRHMRAALNAQINKTDRNDARGIAQMMRAGLYRPVHVKTLRSQKLRMLLTHRKLLQSKAIAIENDLRATLRNFGLKVGIVGTVKFEARIKELVANLPDVALRVEPLLVVRRVLREQVGILHRRLLAVVRDDDVCRRLMTIPGVGPVVALTYRATVDVPARFRNSKAVGAVFGLTPSRYQSGESDRTGGISR